MKPLLHIYLEELSPEEMVDFCQTQLDNTPETKKVVKKMYNAATGEANKLIKAWLEKKHMSADQIRCVLGLFQDYEQLDMLVELAVEDGIIEPGKILNSNSGKIKELISSALKKYEVTDSFIGELIATQPGQGGVTVGPAEIALMLLVKGCTQNNTKESDEPENAEEAEEVGADLKMGGKGVEIKGKTAMLMGQGIEVNPSDWIKQTKQKYKFDIKPNIKETEQDKKFLDIISDPEKLSKFAEDTMGNYVSPGNKFFNKYVEWLGTGKVKTFREFALSVALYGLQVYQQKEGFHKVMLINTGSKQYPYLMVSFNGKGSRDIDSLWEECYGKVDAKTFIKASDKRCGLPKVTYDAK